jgi:hypothetical protein
MSRVKKKTVLVNILVMLVNTVNKANSNICFSPPLFLCVTAGHGHLVIGQEVKLNRYLVKFSGERKANYMFECTTQLLYFGGNISFPNYFALPRSSCVWVCLILFFRVGFIWTNSNNMN